MCIRDRFSIVELQSGAICLASRQPEVLHDLAESDGPRLDVGLELFRRHLAEAGTDIPEVDIGEHGEAILVLRRAECLDVLSHLLTRDAPRIAGHHHDPQIQRTMALTTPSMASADVN